MIRALLPAPNKKFNMSQAEVNSNLIGDGAGMRKDLERKRGLEKRAFDVSLTLIGPGVTSQILTDAVGLHPNASVARHSPPIALAPAPSQRTVPRG